MLFKNYLIVASSVVMLAAFVTGCNEDDKYVNNYNCAYHINLLNAAYPGFSEKCSEKSLGIYNDFFKTYTASRLTPPFNGDDLVKAKQAETVVNSWVNEKNKLTDADIENFKLKHPAAFSQDAVYR